MNSKLQKKLNITKLIGRGGFGDVYKAFDPETQTFQAVKVS